MASDPPAQFTDATERAFALGAWRRRHQGLELPVPDEQVFDASFRGSFATLDSYLETDCREVQDLDWFLDRMLRNETRPFVDVDIPAYGRWLVATGQAIAIARPDVGVWVFHYQPNQPGNG